MRNIKDWLIGSNDKPPLLLFGVFTLFCILLNGYDFADANSDQPLYLPYMPVYFDWSLYVGSDHFMRFIFKTYTTLWVALYGVVKIVGWEWGFFGTYLVVTFFLQWGLWALSMQLFNDRRAALLTLFLLLFRREIGGTGTSYNEIILANRLIVLPFVLFGLRDFLRGKYISCAVLYGLAFHAHIFSVIHWIFLIVLTMAFQFKNIFYVDDERGEKKFHVKIVKRLLIAASIFILMILPLLIWKQMTSSTMPEGFTFDEWFLLMRYRHGYLFLEHWRPRSWWNTLGYSLILLISLWQFKKKGMLPLGIAVVITVVFYIGIQYITVYKFIMQPIFQLQTSRVISLLFIFGLIGSGRVISTFAEKQSGWISALAFAGLMSVILFAGQNHFFIFAILLLLLTLNIHKFIPAFMISIATVVAILVLALLTKNDAGRYTNMQLLLPVFGMIIFFFATLPIFYLRNKMIHGCCVVLLLVLMVGLNLPWSIWQQPKIAPALRSHYTRLIQFPGRVFDEPWLQLQLWAKENTPEQSAFFTPFYRQGFRMFSERSSFCETKDGALALFDPEYAVIWREKMSALVSWPDFYHPSNSKQYHNHSAKAWWKLAKKYDVRYLVTEQPIKYPFEKRVQIGPFTVWEIPFDLDIDLIAAREFDGNVRFDVHDPEIFIQGWGGIEKNDAGAFRWVNEIEAELKLPLLEPADRKITFRCAPLAYPNWQGSNFTVLINGEATGKVDLVAGEKEYQLSVPAKFWRKYENRMVLKFESISKVSDVIPGAADSRTLAAYFRVIKIEEDN